jgi:hypothetical protein
MDATNNRIHSQRAANGINMFRGAVMAVLLTSSFLTALPSTTFANGRDGDRRDDKGRHSLVQHPYDAHAVKNPFAILQAQVDVLTMKVNQLILENDKLKGLPDALGTMKTSVDTMQTSVATTQVSVKTLETKTADSIALSQYVKVDTKEIPGMIGPHILITGANVHVRSGSGFTNDNGTPTGLGNLIIGYNENTMPTPILVRNGSHNLVGGGMNSFSSVGGIVFGYQNTISGPYANVVGGSVNLAQGLNSTVYGSTLQRAVNLNSYMPQAARTATGQ